jgi:hypothetical protein
MADIDERGVDLFIKTRAQPPVVVGLKWTTEAPTQKGWYWAFDETDRKSGVLMLNVDNDGIGYHLVAWDADIPTNISSYTHWLGPLPVPESPV